MGFKIRAQGHWPGCCICSVGCENGLITHTHAHTHTYTPQRFIFLILLLHWEWINVAEAQWWTCSPLAIWWACFLIKQPPEKMMTLRWPLSLIRAWPRSPLPLQRGLWAEPRQYLMMHILQKKRGVWGVTLDIWLFWKWQISSNDNLGQIAPAWQRLKTSTAFKSFTWAIGKIMKMVMRACYLQGQQKTITFSV